MSFALLSTPLLPSRGTAAPPVFSSDDAALRTEFRRLERELSRLGGDAEAAKAAARDDAARGVAAELYAKAAGISVRAFLLTRLIGRSGTTQMELFRRNVRESFALAPSVKSYLDHELDGALEQTLLWLKQRDVRVDLAADEATLRYVLESLPNGVLAPPGPWSHACISETKASTSSADSNSAEPQSGVVPRSDGTTSGPVGARAVQQRIEYLTASLNDVVKKAEAAQRRVVQNCGDSIFAAAIEAAVLYADAAGIGAEIYLLSRVASTHSTTLERFQEHIRKSYAVIPERNCLLEPHLAGARRRAMEQLQAFGLRVELADDAEELQRHIDILPEAVLAPPTMRAPECPAPPSPPAPAPPREPRPPKSSEILQIDTLVAARLHFILAVTPFSMLRMGIDRKGMLGNVGIEYEPNTGVWAGLYVRSLGYSADRFAAPSESESGRPVGTLAVTGLVGFSDKWAGIAAEGGIGVYESHVGSRVGGRLRIGRISHTHVRASATWFPEGASLIPVYTLLEMLIRIPQNRASDRPLWLEVQLESLGAIIGGAAGLMGIRVGIPAARQRAVHFIRGGVGVGGTWEQNNGGVGPVLSLGYETRWEPGRVRK